MTDISAIKALAFGLLDGGGDIFTNFPGYLSHQLFSSLGGKNTSVNEKTAYEIAWGSSFAGRRSAVMFKNVGLNVAADPFLNSMLLGINAGLVIIVFDDVYVEGSQSRQDSRHYFNFFRGLWFEPYNVQNAYDVAYKSFSLSEKYKTPVIIRVTNPLINMSSDLKRKKKQKKSNKPVYDHRKFVVHPTNYLYQRKTLLKKNDRIQKYINGLYKNVFVETKDNLFVFGCCVNEQKKYLKDNYGRVQFFTYPLPQKTTNLIKKSKNLIVLEQGDDFACREVGNLTKNLLLGNNTGSMPDMSKNYIVSKNYEKLFSAVKAIRPTFVIGDLGEYTKDTYGTIDACLCLGSSIGVATGCALAGYQKSLVITGDGAYLHSGKNALMESIERKITLKIVVLCNGGCRVTGGQKIPGDLFDQPKEVRVFKLNYDKTTTAVFKETLKKMIDSKFTTILYVLM